jgi:hypothetical protein
MLFVMYEVEAGSVRISVVVTTANGQPEISRDREL